MTGSDVDGIASSTIGYLFLPFVSDQLMIELKAISFRCTILSSGFKNEKELHEDRKLYKVL